MTDKRMTPTQPGVPVQVFAIQAGIALFVFSAAVFIGIFWRVAFLAQQTAVQQASSFIDLIVDVRAWNASHGGVWVAKTPTSPTNPYLRTLGIDPDTSTVSGTKLTLRNPAAMTREISTITSETNEVTFRLTSLKPVNPDSAPDEWESEQLARFTTNQTEASRIEDSPGGRVLRLMRPLLVEESCLTCHAAQGYRVGDVRGAISVTLPLTESDAAVTQNAIALSGIFMLAVAVAGVTGYSLVRQMAQRIDASEEMLRAAATTDALTGVSNRRAVLERLEIELAHSRRTGRGLGVVILDADLFKDVNDVHGHAAGDTVLREIAARLTTQLREYDVLGRIGGEEFLVVAADIDPDGNTALAERLRSAVDDGPIEHEGVSISTTMSAGTAFARKGDTPDAIVARADEALYRAKAGGRNRVETG